MVKNPLTSAGDAGDARLIPGFRRSPRGRNSKPLQYSCPQNSMDRGPWWAIVHRVVKSWTEHTHRILKKLFLILKIKLSMYSFPPRKEIPKVSNSSWLFNYIESVFRWQSAVIAKSFFWGLSHHVDFLVREGQSDQFLPEWSRSAHLSPFTGSFTVCLALQVIFKAHPEHWSLGLTLKGQSLSGQRNTYFLF